MKNKNYYYAFAIVLVGVLIAIGCRKGDVSQPERTADLKASTRAELLSKLDLRLQNVQDFSKDQDMVEFTKLMDETMEYNSAKVYKALREKKKLNKITIPENASMSDLKRIYSAAGREEEFEKASATFDKQATLVTSFMKRHPELGKLSKDELSMVFLKAFKLNHASATKESASIYRKVQESEMQKCQAYFNSATKANEDSYFNSAASITAGYAVAEAACILTGPGYPACFAAATATYGISMLYVQQNYNDNINTNVVNYNICMSGLSRGVSGEYKEKAKVIYSL